MRREQRHGFASTGGDGGPSVRPVQRLNFSGSLSLPPSPLLILRFSSRSLRFDSTRFHSALSVVVARKVSFPLNLLRGGKKGKREQSSKKNPAEREREGGRRGRRRMAEKVGNLSSSLGTDVYVSFVLHCLSFPLIGCSDANTSEEPSFSTPTLVSMPFHEQYVPKIP